MSMNTDTTPSSTQFVTPEPEQEQAPSRACVAQPASRTAEAEPFGPVIYAYTRAQAIEDGYLVDVSETAEEAGFRIPVALTRAAWNDCVEWDDDDTSRHGCPQDEAGRLWDVLWMARMACRRAVGDRVPVTLVRVPREGRGHLPRRVTLRGVIGGGDHGEPCITIGQPADF